MPAFRLSQVRCQLPVQAVQLCTCEPTGLNLNKQMVKGALGSFASAVTLCFGQFAQTHALNTGQCWTEIGVLYNSSLA